MVHRFLKNKVVKNSMVQQHLTFVVSAVLLHRPGTQNVDPTDRWLSGRGKLEMLVK